MGKAIVYCAVCGKPITAESILLEDAISVQDSYYCKECAQHLNIRTSYKKPLRKPPKPKIDFSETLDISIKRAETKETFVGKYKKELTYMIYGFSIVLIIFSALFIVYKYATNKPTAKEIAEQKCEVILNEIKNKDLSKNQLQSLLHLINLIRASENILQGSLCEKEVFSFLKDAESKVAVLKEQQKLLDELDVIRHKTLSEQLAPEVAILELKNMQDKYRHILLNILNAFYFATDIVVEKLWENLAKKIESEYLYTQLSVEDYEKEIDKFVIENRIDSGDFISSSARTKIIPLIATFKQNLKNKFEEAASKSKEVLISEVAKLTEKGECEAAKLKILNFPEKYVGTNAYKAVKLLEEDIKVNCKTRTEDKKEEEHGAEKPSHIPPEFHILPPVTEKMEEEKEVLQPTTTSVIKKESEKIKIFNGKNLNDWLKINNNATWQVWEKNLYGLLPSSDKNLSIIYFSKRQFKNFSISFRYKLISGMFFVGYHISKDKTSVKYSYLYLNNYEKNSDYATFSGKVIDSVAVVNAPQGENGDAVVDPSLKEGFLGFIIVPGTEIYFKDIVVEEINQTSTELKTSIEVSLFNGQDLKNWQKAGARGDWSVVNGTLYGENNISKQDSKTIDLSTLSVLYFNDNNFKPEWTNYMVSFEFNIAEDGFIVFGKYPIEGSSSGTHITKRFFEIGQWYQAQVIVTPEKIVTKFSDEKITDVEEKVSEDLKGFFGFGILPGQKVYLRNIKLRFLK